MIAKEPGGNKVNGKDKHLGSCNKRTTGCIFKRGECRREPFMFLIAVIAWAGGVIISLYNGNRKLPLTILLLGVGLLFTPIGVWGIVGIAILAAIIWIANKADMG